MVAELLAISLLATTPAAPQSATYEEIANLQGFSPLSFEPWSKRGLLGLTGRGGLYVFDPAKPGSRPRLVASESIGSARWSPDGGWLVVSKGNSLITIRVSDSARDTVYTGGSPLWPYLWASDGRIYGWSGHRPSGRVVVDPPARWRAEHPEPREAHATILTVIPGPFGFMPGANPSEWSLPYDRIMVADPFPGDSLFLVWGNGKSSVADVHGREIRQLSHSTALWTSVSSDGRLVIGFREIETADGETIAHSILHVGDAQGRWFLRLQGARDGVLPKWAPNDYVFCAEDPITFSTRVGRVVLKP